MAQGEASLVVRLVDKASKGLKGLGGVLQKLREHYLAIGASVAAVTAFVVSSTKAFIAQEDAVAKAAKSLASIP